MPRILSVGQCGYDHSTISGQLRRWLDAQVVAAASHRAALDQLRAERFDLVLVNRVTDGDGTRGVALIDAMKGDPALADVPVMLVSDYPDAQADAEARGALPGFGKSTLSAENTRRRIEAAIAAQAPDGPLRTEG